MREVIKSSEAPQPIGPFSQAIRAGGFIFVSGTVAMNPATGAVESEDIRAQTELVLENLSAVLRAAGSSLENVVRVGVFLRNMGDFAAMNEIYARHFPSSPPARTTVEVSRLPKEALVEMDVIALA